MAVAFLSPYLDGLWTRLGFIPVLLWTDLIVFALIGAVGIWLRLALRREYWRVAFRQVGGNRMAMLCFGLLCLYAAPAFLDTLHFKPVTAESPRGGNVISVLDLICQPLRERTEKTYSAPFATHSFSMENVVRDGQQVREYPPLKHIGLFKGPPEAEARAAIRGRALVGLFWGLAVGALFFLASWLFDRMRAARSQEPRAKSYWTAAFLTFVAILVAEAIALNANGGFHIFGTDKAGVDVFYVSLKSIRTGLIIGTLTTLIVTPFAILFGALAGYFGGRVDDIVQYVYTTLDSIPDILLIAAAMLIVQTRLNTQQETIFAADHRLLWLCIIMGITSWTGLCRRIRAEVLKLREAEYVQAADAFGIGRATIMFRHLVPNVMHLVLISVVLRFSGLVLSEAILAYIGIGVDPSTHSWGNMINQARLELARDPVVWWSLASAFVFMLGLVLPANIFGDAVRDALDPRLRTR